MDDVLSKQALAARRPIFGLLLTAAMLMASLASAIPVPAPPVPLNYAFLGYTDLDDYTGSTQVDGMTWPGLWTVDPREGKHYRTLLTPDASCEEDGTLFGDILMNFQSPTGVPMGNRTIPFHGRGHFNESFRWDIQESGPPKTLFKWNSNAFVNGFLRDSITHEPYSVRGWIHTGGVYPNANNPQIPHTPDLWEGTVRTRFTNDSFGIGDIQLDFDSDAREDARFYMSKEATKIARNLRSAKSNAYWESPFGDRTGGTTLFNMRYRNPDSAIPGYLRLTSRNCSSYAGHGVFLDDTYDEVAQDYAGDHWIDPLQLDFTTNYIVTSTPQAAQTYRFNYPRSYWGDE